MDCLCNQSKSMVEILFPPYVQCVIYKSYVQYECANKIAISVPQTPLGFSYLPFTLY